MLPMIANVLDTSIDSLLGYKSFVVSDYDKRYDTADYYWCYIVKAFDLSGAGIEKGKKLAEKCNTYVDFLKLT